jgi:hypothetical protein
MSFVLTRRRISSPLRTLDRFNRVALRSDVPLSPVVRGSTDSPFPLDADDVALAANTSAPVAGVRLGSRARIAGGIRCKSGALVASGRFKSGALVACIRKV